MITDIKLTGREDGYAEAEIRDDRAISSVNLQRGYTITHTYTYSVFEFTMRKGALLGKVQCTGAPVKLIQLENAATKTKMIMERTGEMTTPHNLTEWTSAKVTFETQKGSVVRVHFVPADFCVDLRHLPERKLHEDTALKCKNNQTVMISRMAASAVAALFRKSDAIGCSAALDLTDYDASAVEAAKRIFYTHRIQGRDVDDNVEVIRLLDYLCFEDLDAAWIVAQHVLSPSNCARLLDIAVDIGREEDAQRIVQFMCNNIERLAVKDAKAFAAAFIVL